jgi:hypothetical protein
LFDIFDKKMKENKSDFTLYDAVDLIVLIYLWYIRLLIFNTLQLLEQLCYGILMIRDHQFWVTNSQLLDDK